jgi:hypothetical protein
MHETPPEVKCLPLQQNLAPTYALRYEDASYRRSPQIALVSLRLHACIIRIQTADSPMITNSEFRVWCQAEAEFPGARVLSLGMAGGRKVPLL